MLKISEQIVRRFAELEDQVRVIRLQTGQGGTTPHAEPEAFYAWASSAMNAIEGAFGSESAHALSFKKEIAGINSNLVWDRKFESIRGIFRGAKSDVDGGYVFDQTGRASCRERV